MVDKVETQTKTTNGIEKNHTKKEWNTIKNNFRFILHNPVYLTPSIQSFSQTQLDLSLN